MIFFYFCLAEQRYIFFALVFKYNDEKSIIIYYEKKQKIISNDVDIVDVIYVTSSRQYSECQ